MSKYRFPASIRTKIILMTLGLALPPLLVLGWLSLSSLDRARDTAVAEGTDTLRKQAEETLKSRAADKAQLYDSALQNIKQQVIATARYSEELLQSEGEATFQGRVWVAPDGPSAANLSRHAQEVEQVRRLVPLLRTMISPNKLVNIGYVALDQGGVIAFDDEQVIDALLERGSFDPRVRPWYKEARERGTTIWTDAYVDANTLALTTTCATPLYDRRGNFLGVVGFDLLLTTIQDDLLMLDIGRQGRAFLVNAAGDVVVQPDLQPGSTLWHESFRTENWLASPSPALRAITERMLQAERGVELIDIEGTSSYIAFAPISAAGWSVALVIPADDIVRPALETGGRIAQRQIELRNQFLILLSLIIVLIGAMGLMLSLTFTRRISEIRRGTQLVTGGQLDYQLPEAGSDEIGQLVNAFNTMTISLRDKISELENNAHQLARLNQVSNQLKAILDLPDLLQVIPDEVCRHFGFERAALYLVEPETHLLRVVSASFGAGNEEQACHFIEVANATPISLDSATIEADIVRSGQAVIVTEPWKHPRVLQAKQTVSGGQSYVQVPIFGREERVIGLLSADYELSHRPVTAQDASQLLMFANMVGLTIENVRIYDDLEQQVARRTEELRAAMERAQMADRRKGDFLTSISHELRTPLNAIIGFSNVLLDDIDGPLSSTQREDVQSINRNGRFLLHMINELLDLARIEAGYLNLEPAPLVLYPLIDEAIDTTKALLRGRGVGLQYDLPDDLPQVYADADRVRQILLNLLSNAVKFTERGIISISALVVTEVSASGWVGEFVAISVRDTGIGIPLEFQEQVFEEFRQIHGRRSRIRGTGLGLSITRRLVEAQDGRIWLESIPEQGSTFTFTLPVYTPEKYGDNHRAPAVVTNGKQAVASGHERDGPAGMA